MSCRSMHVWRLFQTDAVLSAECQLSILHISYLAPGDAGNCKNPPKLDSGRFQSTTCVIEGGVDSDALIDY